MKNATFRAVSFAYPSVSPQGEPVMLSGCVVFPILTMNKPSRMLIYHRILAVGKNPPPSAEIPLEAVLAADNTICVFPDYYGCGITAGKTQPFIALNYHAQCATECAIAALNIVKDCEVELDDDFYTWNTGYSQGAGFALATQRFIETSMPDSLQHLINLKWSLCCGGIYSPQELYKEAVRGKHMGSEPAVYLYGMHSLFYSHQNEMDSMNFCDVLSQKLLDYKIDSVLEANNSGLFDLSNKLGEICGNDVPANYFSPFVTDTSTTLFNKLYHIFTLDDCIQNWSPKIPIVLVHSKKDKCIPFHCALQTHSKLSCPDNNRCILYTPNINWSHRVLGFFYFTKILRIREDELYFNVGLRLTNDRL